MKLDKLAFNWGSQTIVIYVNIILKEGGIVFDTKKFYGLQNAKKVSIWSPPYLQKQICQTTMKCIKISALLLIVIWNI